MNAELEEWVRKLGAVPLPEMTGKRDSEIVKNIHHVPNTGQLGGLLIGECDGTPYMKNGNTCWLAPVKTAREVPAARKRILVGLYGEEGAKMAVIMDGGDEFPLKVFNRLTRVTDADRENLRLWVSVWASVRVGVRTSMWDSVWAYVGYLFHANGVVKEWNYVKRDVGEYPFMAAVRLLERGFVPVLVGEEWKLWHVTRERFEYTLVVDA